MDTAARVEAAMARLEAGKAVALRAAEAGPPCAGCACFVKDMALCGHPAYSEHQFNPIAGEIRQEIAVPAVQARSDDGLCGPEALLFERAYPVLGPVLGAAKFILAIGGIYLVGMLALFGALTIMQRGFS